MADLIAPHEGLGLINRTRNALVPFQEKIVLSDADLSSLYRNGDGGLSPLIGPMVQEEWNRVLDEEVIIRNGKKYAWTIPIAFSITAIEANAIKLKETVGLVNSKGEVVGTLHLKDIDPWDKPRYIKSVYATERTDHPGGQMVTTDERTTLVGGEVYVLPQPKHTEYGDVVLPPTETRACRRSVKVGSAAIYAELGRVGLTDDHASTGWKPVSISGRDLREQLRAGQLPDPRIMRPETAHVLIERMKATYTPLRKGGQVFGTIE